MGAWETEPDELEFEHEGFQCRILRVKDLGHLCGYVGVPKNNKAYGIDFSAGDLDIFDVHGGVTYSRAEKGSDLWWIGFDCAHLGDRIPKAHGCRECGTYRDIAYVKAQTESLAKQIKEKM